MKAFLMIAILALSLLSTKEAKANLFYDSCLAVPQQKVPMMFGPGGTKAFGLTCQQIRDAEESYALVSATLIPSAIALKAAGTGAAISAELAALGLTMANPVVLSVTVIGATGLTVVYFILRESMKECEREDRQAEIALEVARELERRNIKSNGPIKLKIVKP